MKNADKWKPTKFVYNKEGKLVANKNFVNLSSLLVTNKVATLYGKYLKKYASGTIADLGCGTVPLYHIYKDQVKKVICIDWENAYHKNIHLDYSTDLNKELPLERNSVDTILLSDVLEHIANPEKLMAEIGKALRIEGKLVLGVPFFYWLHEEPYDFHRYTKYKLIMFCEKNDMEVIKLEEYGGPLSIIMDIIGKNLPSKLGPRFFQKFANWFVNTRIGKRIDERGKENFPLGYCLVASKKEVY